MSRKEQPDVPEDDIPLWVVSFTDMITLLLAFFVLLQAFAHEPDPQKFFEGQGSFKRAIKEFGLPEWNKGKQNRIRRDWFIRRHAPKPDPESQLNEDPIDEQEELLQKAFQDIKEKMDTNSENYRFRPLRVTATPILFQTGSDGLTPKDRRYLQQLVVDLQSNLNPRSTAIYVVGLAPNTPNDMQSYILSTLRAETIEHLLRNALTRDGRAWNVYGWGGGRQFGRFPQGTRIGLVVLGEDHGR